VWFAALIACHDAVPVEEQIVDVGCAMCVYQMEDAAGCYWAAELEGEPWVVVGHTPEDHQNHAPDGMCNVERRARVVGELRDARFYVSDFELLPPEVVPETPRFTPEHEH